MGHRQTPVAACLILVVAALTLSAKPIGPMEVDAAAVFRQALRARLASGKPDDATAFLRDTLKTAPISEKPALREYYWREMARAGRPLEGYQAFSAGKDAFAVLADQLLASGRIGELTDLIREHAIFYGDDPYLDVYRGALAFENKKYADADAAWTTAFPSVEDPYLHSQFHRRRVRARHAVGKTLEALRDIPPNRDTFTLLADLLLKQRQHDQLEKLLDAYGKTQWSSTLINEYYLRMHSGEDAARLLKIGAGKGVGMFEIYSVLTKEGRALEAYHATVNRKSGFSTLSQNLLSRGRFGELRKLIEIHRKAEPDDPQIDHAEGVLFLETNQLDKALVRLKKAQAAAGRFSMERHKYVEASHRAGKALNVFEELGFDDSTFGMLAIMCVSDRDAAGLQSLLNARPPGKGFREKEIWKHQLDLKILTRKPDEAMALFRTHRKEPSKTESKFVTRGRELEESEFAVKMATIGRGLEAYRNAEFAEEVFARIAAHYRRNNDLEGLAKLVAAHAGKFPKSPEVALNNGFLALSRGKLHAAERIFRAELAKPLPTVAGDGMAKFDGDLRHRIHRNNLKFGLMRTLIRQGRTVEQYRSDGADTEAFAWIAYVCVQEKATAELDALVAVHRKGHPNDGGLAAIEAELLFLKGDYKAAFEIFKKMDDAYSERGKALVCLVRLKRFAEAAKLAKDWEVNTRMQPTPLVLAHAAAGDVAQTLRLMEVYRGLNYREEFYRDEDLGRILRSAAMRQVRERFPEPGPN